MLLIHVTNVNRSCIAMQHVRRSTDINIRRSARDEWWNCMMRNYLNIRHNHLEIAQYASYDCQRQEKNGRSCLVVEKLYAVDVFMLFSQEQKVILCAPFAEFYILPQMRRLSNDTRNEWR